MLAQTAPSTPLIDPRGVLDHFRPTPAPATVSRGGIIEINGTNLGPGTTVSATTAPLPTTLGTPAVQALLNGTAMPLFSVSSTQVVAQVPYDAPLGAVSITVSVGGAAGPAAAVTIAATQPSIRTADGSGSGVFAGTSAAGTVTLAVSGLGATQPPLTAGVLPASAGTVPSAAVTAYIGGVRVNATATASTTRVGEFDVQLNVPATAVPGQLINLIAGGSASNAVVYQALAAPVTIMQPLPSGFPAIVSLATPDVSGEFVIPFAAKDSSGCWSALWFDMATKKNGAFNTCLADPAGIASSPVVLPANSEFAGGLVGPASTSVAIASPDDDSVKTANLPSAAGTLMATGSTFVATITGNPASIVTIDGLTGNVQDGGAGGFPAGAAGGLPTGAFSPIAAFTININGLTHVLTTPVSLGAGQFALIAGNDAIAPTQALYAVVDSTGAAIATQPFPAGWLPLIPAKSGAGGFDVLEGSSHNASTRKFFALVRAADLSHDAFLIFPDDASAAPTVSAFPTNWFAASCAGTIQFASVALYPALVFPGSNTAGTTYKSPCGSGGFLTLDLTTGTVAAHPLGGGQQMDASAITSFNDFIYSTNTDPSGQNVTDAVYVYDAEYQAEYSLQLPSGSVSFSSAQTVTGTDWLLGTVTNSSTGDGGIVKFDLEAGTASVLPVPDGYSAVELTGVFLTTNKLVARGLVSGTSNYQVLIYDLTSKVVTPVPLPDGVASFGPPKQATSTAGGGGPTGGFPGGTPPTGGGPTGGAPTGGGGAPSGGGSGVGAVTRLPTPVANTKSNTVAAPAYDANGAQTGILLLRVP